jgi:hypothetical protein
MLTAIYLLVPLGVTGTVGEAAISESPIAYTVPAFDALIESPAGLVTIMLCCLLMLIMISVTAAAVRPLSGIAQDDMTIRQLGVPNMRGEPIPPEDHRPRHQLGDPLADRNLALRLQTPRAGPKAIEMKGAPAQRRQTTSVCTPVSAEEA